MVTNALLNRIIQFLYTDITHLGIGTGSAPVSTDNLLSNEAERKTVDSLVDGYTLIKEAFWDTNEGNGVTYTNTGIFGNGASSTIGTGELFAGGAINAPKTSTQSLTVSVEITVEAVN